MVIKIRDRSLQTLRNDTGRRQGSNANRKGRTGTKPEGPGTEQREMKLNVCKEDNVLQA